MIRLQANILSDLLRSLFARYGGLSLIFGNVFSDFRLVKVI